MQTVWSYFIDVVLATSLLPALIEGSGHNREQGSAINGPVVHFSHSTNTLHLGRHEAVRQNHWISPDFDLDVRGYSSVQDGHSSSTLFLSRQGDQQGRRFPPGKVWLKEEYLIPVKLTLKFLIYWKHMVLHRRPLMKRKRMESTTRGHVTRKCMECKSLTHQLSRFSTSSLVRTATLSGALLVMCMLASVMAGAVPSIPRSATKFSVRRSKRKVTLCPNKPEVMHYEQ